MRKKIIAVAILLSLTATLGGCANVDGENTSKLADSISVSKSEELSNKYEIPSSSSSNDKTIESSSDSAGESPSKCKIYMQKVKTFTEDQLLSFFSETPERIYYDETNTIVYTSGTERGNTDGTDLTFLTDAGMLCAMSYDMVGSSYDGEQSKIENLDFAAFGEVLEAVEKQMIKFGFTSDEWFVNKVYTIKADDLDRFKETQYNAANENPYNLDESELQKEIEQANRINKYPSKDSYYIDLRFKIDNIKMYTGNGLQYGGDANYQILGSSCTVCYSKDGFELISIYNVCETESSEDTDIISPNEAQKLITHKYNDIIFNGEIEVNSMELIYMAIPQNDLNVYFSNFETRPFYVFYYTLTEECYGETISSNVITYFDAVTGNELATERISAIDG